MVYFDYIGGIVAPEFIVLKVIRIKELMERVGISADVAGRILPYFESFSFFLVDPLLSIISFDDIEVLWLFAGVSHG